LNPLKFFIDIWEPNLEVFDRIFILVRNGTFTFRIG
jgi:hypothetical protein